MSPQYRITGRSYQDLQQIYDHIAAESPTAANAFIDEFFAKCTTLARYPHLGRPRDEFAPGLRSLLLGRYLIFYRALADGVEIRRILHGARNISGDSFEEQED